MASLRWSCIACPYLVCPYLVAPDGVLYWFEDDWYDWFNPWANAARAGHAVGTVYGMVVSFDDDAERLRRRRESIIQNSGVNPRDLRRVDAQVSQVCDGLRMGLESTKILVSSGFILGVDRRSGCSHT
jgi:hypothetical protein